MIITIATGAVAAMTPFGQFQGELKNHIKDSEEVISSFKDIQKNTCALSGGVGTLDVAMDQIDSRILLEENRKSNTQTTLDKSNDFVELANRIDKQVNSDVNQNKEEFYCVNPWARPPEPEEDKGFFGNLWDSFCEDIQAIGNALSDAWEWTKDTAKKAWDGLKTFYEEHTAEFWAIVATTVLSIVAIALCPFTGGASLILYTAAVSAISAGVVSFVRSAETQKKENGSIDWGKAFLEGGKSAAIGFVTGVIGGSLGQFLAGSLSSSASSLLSSSNLGTRMLVAFGIGATAETGTGIVVRGTESTLEQLAENGTVDFGEVMDSAFDPSSMLLDATIGGATQATVEYHQYKADMSVRSFNENNDPVGKAAEKGYELNSSKNGTLDYSGTDYIKKSADGREVIIEIDATGSRSGDFSQAWQQAADKYGIDKNTFDNVTWQHMDDYNGRTNKMTLQLVDTDAHMGIKHSGGCKQYSIFKGTGKYK